MGATQRRSRRLAFSEPSGPFAWKSLPVWAVVATGDRAAGTDVIRSMSERAGATMTEAEGSHVVVVSQPEAVAEVILSVAASLDRPVAATAR
jgi:hypothetical protein